MEVKWKWCSYFQRMRNTPNGNGIIKCLTNLCGRSVFHNLFDVDSKLVLINSLTKINGQESTQKFIYF